ncbi:VTT domain-containing protein [Sinirhodobacter sp. WL0062]|uniref:VTT domain-containing protein n=1 Tax=Rhodobacter flavimaris TaxID=2907145 RepID=A0ABS8YUB4_9RHOB|nr:VTT domain-containing protein [Sinirhodobacter sp. WL0062]MCE5972041.1 VTT domain-containing protein [Sinirhodobacter sp. WL0062]
MIGLETVIALISKHGLTLVAPIAVIEGPIVTVIAAWLASQHLMDLWRVTLVVVLADLIGDLIWYSLGRWGLAHLPQGILRRLGLRPARLELLAGQFRKKGARILIFGKWTHSAGAAILIAAGMARMNVWRFSWVNLAASIPKSLFFVALGYGFGAAYGQIEGWIFRGSLALLVATLLFGAIWLNRRCTRKRPA